MASIEAQIQVILKGSSEIDKLQKKLDGIEDTAISIQDQFERGLFGRSSNLQTYMNALSQIGKAASAVRDQTKEIQSSNSEIKRTILLESQLRRERSRTARLSRAFETETKGLDQTRGKLKEVKEQFDAISDALGQAFKLKDVQIISQLRNELSALVEDQREWNRALAGTKNTGVNADLLKEQSAEYARQISLLRERAEALGSNEVLIRKLNAAERNLVKGRTKEGTFLGFADPRLGREQLKNAKALIQEEERLAEIRKRSATEYENQQKQARREIQQTIKTIGGLAQRATGATFDALTFGKGPQIAKGFKNAAIRGGVGLGALGLGGAYAAVQQATGNIDLGMLRGPATQAASAIGGAINNALGGVPAIVGEMLSALGNIPGSLGLASVAALAFAPAMKTAGEAVFLAGKRFGESKFGENIKLTLDRQTNLFESVINRASEMNMVLDASRSGLDAVGQKIQTLPALPAAGQTAFKGELRRGRGGAFMGGGAREIQNAEFLVSASGSIAARTDDAAQMAFRFAEGLGAAVEQAKTLADYLVQAAELRTARNPREERIAQILERGRERLRDKQSAEYARFLSARTLAEQSGAPLFPQVLALPAAGQTSFKGEIRQVGAAAGERGGMFLGGGARVALKNAEFLTNAAGNLAARTKDAAEQSLRYAKNLNRAAVSADSINLTSPESTGLENALKRLEEARGARQKFLGGASPAQAIDQIVREFNKGGPAAGDAAKNIASTFASNLKEGASGAAASAKSFATAATQAIKNVFGIASPSRFMIELVQNLVNTYIAEMQKSYPRIQAATDKAFGEQTLLRNVKELRATSRGFEFAERPSRGFRPFREAQGFGRGTEGATQEFNNMMLDFRKQIAELTTQPEIFSNLLRGLPDARITTDLIGAANRRALASELPSFMPTQRMMGSGELEREIAKAFADYVRTIRTPDPWVGLVGDYREFIDKVIAQTQRLSTGQAALPGVRIAGALPVAEQRITSVQQQRIQRAYERSTQRQLAVLSEDAFAGAGRPALSAASFGFMADPARIGRLSGIGRALPPAIDVAASVVDGESRDLREAVRGLFDRISQGLGSVFGSGGGGTGGGGGPTRDPGDFSRRLSTAAEQGAEALLGLQELRDPTKATTLEIEALSNVLKEFRKILDPTVEGFDRLERQLRESAANLDLQLERRAPEAGFLTRRFGPRTARGLSEGLIGGAFPLLFGQGVGAAVGGGAGGFAGGFAGGGLGFGLSLAGTALGTVFDALNQAAQDTGKALKYPVEGFEKLKEAGLLAGRQQEYYISKLIEAGRATEAASIIQSEIIKKIGVRGVEDLKRLGDSSSRLSKAWGEFGLQLQAALAGPMTGLLNWITGIVEASNRRGREEAARRDLFKGLSSADQIEVNKKISQEIQARGGAEQVGVQGIEGIRQQVLQQFASRSNLVPSATQLTPEQLDAQKKAQAVTKELQAQVSLQSKQLSLAGLTLERDGARYVNAAKAVAIQEYDNKLLEIKNSWIGQNFNKEQDLAKIRGANLQLAAQLKQINEEVARRQEELYQNSLQAEIALYQQKQKNIDIVIRTAEFNRGEEAGLYKKLALTEEINRTKIAEFQAEEELALIAAQKNGTYEQTSRLFQARSVALKAELKLEEAITRQQIAQLQFNKFISIEQAKREAVDPFAQFRQSQQFDQQYAQTYHRLLTEGIAPAEARRIADFERLVAQQLKSLDIQVAIAQSTYNEAVARGIAGQELKNYADNLERLKEARGAAAKDAAAGPGPAPQEIPGAKIQEFISTAEEELKDLEALAVRVSQGIGDAIASSMANGITGLIEGTTTAKEVFAGFLKDVGNILIKEGTRMIGMYIAIGIAKMFAGLLSGAGGASKPALPGSMGKATTSGITTGAGNISDMLDGLAANGAYFANGVAAFAKGGMFTNSVVSSPTLFKFADGGVQRTGLMGEAGPEAIMPLRRSASGRLGVEASGLREAMNSSTGGGTGAPLLNMTFETTNIGGVEYVSRDQLEAAMAATRRDAARDGAKRGMSMTLDKLQQSPGTRGRVGLR